MMPLDASGLVAFFANQPAAAQVGQLLREREVAINAVNLAEVVDHMLRVRRHSAQKLAEAIDILLDYGLVVMPIETSDGRRAGELRARHYHRTRQLLSLADCLLLAAAVEQHVPVATSDTALASLARELQVEVVPLPNSAGQLP